MIEQNYVQQNYAEQKYMDEALAFLGVSPSIRQRATAKRHLVRETSFHELSARVHWPSQWHGEECARNTPPARREKTKNGEKMRENIEICATRRCKSFNVVARRKTVIQNRPQTAQGALDHKPQEKIRSACAVSFITNTRIAKVPGFRSIVFGIDKNQRILPAHRIAYFFIFFHISALVTAQNPR